MDTTETYIKMHLALPIELIEEPQEGDYFYNTENGKTGKLGEAWEELRMPLIQLYEQDQLQEMVKGTKHSHLLAYEFACYFHGTMDPLYASISRDNFTVDSDNSMEQMWLAYMMHKLYQKVWSNGEWVKEGTNGCYP